MGKVAIYDYQQEKDEYFCRLFGSNLIDLSGVDMTGKPMSLYPSTLYQLLRTHYDECRFTGRPFSSTYETRAVESWNDQLSYGHKVLAEKIILPLSRSGAGWDCFFSFVEEITPT